MVRLVACLVALVVTAASCHSLAPPNGPDSSCQRACHDRLGHLCNATQCERGCHLILDRVIEHESDTVLACLAKSTRECSETVWSECAARIGPRTDGGPPAPTTETFPDED